MSTADHQGQGDAGPAFTDRVVRRGMRINIAAGALGNMWMAAALGIPLTMFMDLLGASGVLIGLTVTVQQVAMLLQVPSSLLAERLAVRKTFWAAVNLPQRLLWFVPAILPLFLAGNTRTMAHVMVGIVALSALLSNAAAAAWWSWMADLIPERVRGRFWGRRQSLVTIAFLFAVWGSGRLLDVFPDPREPGGSFLGFMIVFALGAAAGCADIVTHLWVPEPHVPRAAARTGVLRKLAAPFKSRGFTRATLAIGIWTFALGTVGSFSALYLKRAFDVSYTDLSATVISASLGVVIAGVLWGYVMDRIGARNLGIIAMILAPAFGLVWFFMQAGFVTIDLPFLPAFTLPRSIAILLVVNLVAGGVYSAVGLAQVGLIADLAPREGRTLAMAVHWSIAGLMGALGPVTGGQVMDWFHQHAFDWTLPTGTRFDFFHVLVILQMAIVWLLAVPTLWRLERRPGEVGVRTALSWLMGGNPLRVVGSIYGVFAMNAAVSIRARANAMRKIGADRTAIAVSDVIATLDDPAADVREEAVVALGRIGSREAVDALLAILNDPNSDLIPQVARALRHAHDPRAVSSLVARLSDSDRETVAEAARALGEIGDQRASQSLIEVLRGTDDPKVVSAASAALGRLGEMAAIYEIVPRMAETHNPVLKRSLAVALGDLLGRSGEFYRIYVLEQRSHASESTRLLEDLSDSIRKATDSRLSRQGESLIGRIRELETAYEQSEIERAVELLFNLAIGLAALHYGLDSGGDPEVLIEALVWHNERFALGLWYLDVLRQAAKKDDVRFVDRTDVLLGIYILSGWTVAEDEAVHNPEGSAAPKA